MSLSNERQSAAWGTIFMGPGPGMETTLERVEAGGPSLAWTVDTEAEYMARVREKATAKAKEILLAAQAEAAAMHERAYAEGYEAGLNQAQLELEEFRQGMGASLAAVLGAIEDNAPRIAAAWREELVGLTRLCVETAINHELSASRAALLAGLFDGAAAKMAKARRIAILVNPEDEPAVADMLDAAGQTGEQTFTVRGEATLPPGSLVLESDDSRVDNSLPVRKALVDHVLAQLIMPADDPAEAATAAPAVAAEDVLPAGPADPVKPAEAAPAEAVPAEAVLTDQPENAPTPEFIAEEPGPEIQFAPEGAVAEPVTMAAPEAAAGFVPENFEVAAQPEQDLAPAQEGAVAEPAAALAAQGAAVPALIPEAAAGADQSEAAPLAEAQNLNTETP